MPSNRSLVAEYGASPLTVQKAMRQLMGLGLIESRPGVGTFVRPGRSLSNVDYGWQTAALGSPQSRASALSATQRTTAPDAIGLHSGYPARELLPERLVRAAITRAARSDGALTRSPASGLPELQAWFAAELAAAGALPRECVGCGSSARAAASGAVCAGRNHRHDGHTARWADAQPRPDTEYGDDGTVL